MIPRNTTIPVARAQEFTTFKDGQSAMMIHVLQGERELVQDCRSLARFTLRGLPPLPAGGAHSRHLPVDADGLLSVTAMEKSTGVEASIEVKPSYGLSDSEIAGMIKDSMANAQSDVGARKLAEQRVEAARVLESLQGALATDAALLSEAESGRSPPRPVRCSRRCRGRSRRYRRRHQNIRCTNARFCRAPHGRFHSPRAGWPFCG